MRRSKAQLNAISRSYAIKREKEQIKIMDEKNWWGEFRNSKYKTLTGFLNNKRKNK